MPPMKMVFVVGPTAAGKTELAMRIAEAAGGEILSADSQQVYRGMDIGTGKATAEQQARVRHHLIDVVDPSEEMTAARYVELADAAIADMARRGKGVVGCGGTGLYVRAFLYGLFPGPPADRAFRDRLAAEAAATGVDKLWERLAAVDPPAAARIERRDLIRITRALEVHELTGRPMSEHQAAHDFTKLARRHDVRLVGLAPPRAELVERIHARVDAMIAGGLVDEVKRLLAAGHDPGARAFAAIGYREIIAHLAGDLALEAAVEQIKKATRRYARRQTIWFRADPTVTWYKAAADVNIGELAAFSRSSAVFQR
jgi:tRNA dimethylallyltransferase